MVALAMMLLVRIQKDMMVLVMKIEDKSSSKKQLPSTNVPTFYFPQTAKAKIRILLRMFKLTVGTS